MEQPLSDPLDRRPVLAFLLAIPIAILGGLIGLGGAEFRFPVLAGPLPIHGRQAVPLNLAVSLVTLGIVALARQGSTLSLERSAALGASHRRHARGRPGHGAGSGRRWQHASATPRWSG